MKGFLKFSLILIIGVIIGIIFNFFFAGKDNNNQPTEVKVLEKQTIITENNALEESIEKVKDAVVAIKNSKGIIVGSGLAVSSDGLMVTFSSLIPNDDNFNFIIGGKMYEKNSYQVLKRDSRKDLALIKLNGEWFKTCGFGDYEDLKIGRTVFLVSKILGEKDSVLYSVNEGIIKYFNEEKIQTNIREDSILVNGSPLFDIKGNCLGLVKIKKAGEVSAIPISEIRGFINL